MCLSNAHDYLLVPALTNLGDLAVREKDISAASGYYQRATDMAAPSSTKSAEGDRGAQMHQTKKGISGVCHEHM